MRNARMTGWGAAALAAVLVATGSPALAAPVEEPTPTESSTQAPSPSSTEAAPADETQAPAETEAVDAPDAEGPTEAPEREPAAEAQAEPRVAALAEPLTGDLVVTAFDDYYADGVFDASKTAVDGSVDRKDAYRVSEALTSTGVRAFGSINAAGDYVFSDLPVGETKVYFTHPGSPNASVFFDATGATAAGDIERLPNGPVPIIGERAIATVNVDENGEALVVGFTGAQAQVAVEYPDGTPVPGLTGVEFGSGGEWFGATEYAGLPGSYAAGAHVPDEIGVRLDVPAGYAIDEVVAVDSISSRELDVAQRDGAYWVESTGLSPNAPRGDFTITLEELPTGDLVVTSFDDYYADGVYDPSKTARDGRTDQTTNGRLYEAITSTGQRASATVDSNGDYRFEDLPVGETKVYFTHPNNPNATVFFDATDAASAADIERLPNGTNPIAGTTGVATVVVDEDGEAITVGMASATSSVTVNNADGSPAVGLTGIEFGSGGEWFDATEYAGLPGSYEVLVGTTGAAHLPDEIGLRVTAPAGYRVSEVELDDAATWPLQPVPFTERDGAYWFDTVDLASYSSRGDFTVTLEELPTASVEVTYFGDVVLDGVFDPAADLPIATAQLFLRDAEGAWWATTAGADGTYRFPGAAIGPATIYAELPAPADVPDVPGIELPDAALSIWDATGLESYRDTVRAATDTISFTGTSIDPITGTGTPVTLTDELVGVVPTDLVEGEQDRAIGAATILQLAAAANAEGLPATDVEIEFLANSESTASTEVEPGTGAFIATDGDEVAVFGAAEFGIRATAAEGFEVVSVTALSLNGDVLDVETPAPATAARMAVFAAAAEYRVAPQQVGGPIGGVIWAVEVAPTAVIPPTVPTLPGTGVDLPSSGITAPVATTLPATGGEHDVWAWMLLAAALLGAGVTARTIVRVRRS